MTMPRTLQIGSHGGTVERLQRLLNLAFPTTVVGPPDDTGPKALVVDGEFGPATLAKVRLFQMLNLLTVDGIVGPKTWRMLLAVDDDRPLGSSG